MKNAIHNAVVKQGINYAQSRMPKTLKSFALNKELTCTDADGCFCFFYTKESSSYKIKIEYDTCTEPETNDNFFMKLINDKNEVVKKAKLNIINFSNFEQVCAKLLEGTPA